jgi:FeS assembly SUF system protein
LEEASGESTVEGVHSAVVQSAFVEKQQVSHKGTKPTKKTFVSFVSLWEIYQEIRKKMDNEFLKLEEKIVTMLKTVYDPEIPVDIYALGLIYNVEAKEGGEVVITMTLTAPNCPAADFIVEDVKMKIESIEGVNKVDVNIVFEPEWNKDMMSEEAKLELGFL